MHCHDVAKGVIFNRDRPICDWDIARSTDILKTVLPLISMGLATLASYIARLCECNEFLFIFGFPY